jgi:acetyl esterase/lipase
MAMDPCTLQEEQTAAKIYEEFARHSTNPISARISTAWINPSGPRLAAENPYASETTRTSALETSLQEVDTGDLLVSLELVNQQREPHTGHQYRYVSWEQYVIRLPLWRLSPDDHEGVSQEAAANLSLQVERLTPAAAAPVEICHALAYESPEAPYRLLFYNSQLADLNPGDGKRLQTTSRVEIWQRDSARHHGNAVPHLERCIRTEKIHGDVYHDTLFCGSAYSSSQQAFFYVAERSRPSVSNPSLRGEVAADLDAMQVDPAKIGKVPSYSPFRHVDDYGEQYGGKLHPRLYVLDIQASDAADWRLYALHIDDSAAPLSVGDMDVADPQCADDTLVWVARQRRIDVPRGHIYCTNRPSFIVIAHLQRQARTEQQRGCDQPVVMARVDVVLGSESLPCYRNRTCPRFVEYDCLIWVEAACDAPHCSGHWIMESRLDLSGAPAGRIRTGPCQCLLPLDADLLPEADQWPGALYPLNPSRVLLEGRTGLLGSEWIVLNTVVGSRARPALLNRNTKTLKLLSEKHQPVPEIAQVLAATRCWLPETLQGRFYPYRMAIEVVIGADMTLITPPTVQVGAHLHKEGIPTMFRHVPSSRPGWVFTNVGRRYDAVWDDCESRRGMISTQRGNKRHQFRIGIVSLSLSHGGFVAGSENPVDRFEAIVVAPDDGMLVDAQHGPPVVLLLHGGPHACFLANVWNPGAALIADLGCILVVPNYCGSLGHGEARLRSLLGRIGEQDVRECRLALRCVLERDDFWRWFDAEASRNDSAVRPPDYKETQPAWRPCWRTVDRARVALVGGSHGGFLAAHLSADEASLVRAAVLRNPVIDIASMVSQTDIVDWCYHECGLEIRRERQASSENPPESSNSVTVDTTDFPENIHRAPLAAELLRMRACSPIMKADQVRAATLLQLGGSDQRVPSFQGFQWARAIRTKAEALRVLFYPRSNHAIEDAPSFDDAWIQCLAWLLKFLGIEDESARTNDEGTTPKQ